MSVSQYLTRYAEPFSSDVIDAIPCVDHVLIIPAYNEPPSLINRLTTLLAAKRRALAIVVINQPATDSDTRANQALFNELAKLPQVQPWCKGLVRAGAGYIYGLDYFSGQGLPPKQGVGLARKLGCDVAVRLYAQGKIRYPWLHCSDADVNFTASYFKAGAVADRHYAAMLYPFEHTATPAYQQAVRLYELRLHWYVAGLRWAGSPYAFHTIGSTLAVNVSHYCKVRGFPKLAAGEDFHLLNKLAKTGPILTLTEPLLELDGRVSQRVPFGTGPSVARLAQQVAPTLAPEFENPAVFVALRTVLASFSALWRDRQSPTVVHNVGLDKLTVAALQHVGFDKTLAHALRQATTVEQFKKQLHTGFDALQTRRFLHYLASHAHPNYSYASLRKHPLAITQLPLLAQPFASDGDY